MLRVDQSVTYMPAAARTIRRWRPDVVHGLFHLDGVTARLARRHPCVVHVQGIPRRAALMGQPIQRRLLRHSFAYADAIVSVSGAAATSLEEEFGHPARTLHNGVDTAPFVSAGLTAGRTSEPTVLFPSAPGDPRKRLDLTIRAVNRIADRWPGLALRVAAPPSPDVEARASTLADVPIDWRRVLTPADMPAEYAAAWVTCAPAVREAFGLVYVESMAAGRPAVGVLDGGVAEVIDDQRWLAEPDDEASLADALHRALQDAQAAATAERCRARAATFDWRERGPAFEGLYRELLAAPNRRRRR
ncbi:MAG: teichuronic acid biosynthesis glycosyltransferase TuaC [Acidimicrobiaceae bacterium]